MRKNFIRSVGVTQSILSVLLQQTPHNVFQLGRIRDFWVTWEGQVVLLNFLENSILPAADEGSVTV